MKKYWIILIAVFLCFAFATLAGKHSSEMLETAMGSSVRRIPYTVVLDAGHGGEDGGAVAADGTPEKDINLQIANGIAAYFDLFGIPYKPVRTTDTAVCDDGLETIRERKRSDILNRYALVNNTENAILLSIHQNMFEEPQYWGTQVFYSSNNDSSRTLALSIRASVYQALQPDNGREVKPSTDSIYLLYRAKTTSVMVECGFLSNPDELAKLETASYDAQMGYYIFKGLLNYINM